jgi:diaminohydroxyphosphoribosylaminopyrimidine deaminase/5-amino-6-(5-phosphoribosylamino)uracil reductase
MLTGAGTVCADLPRLTVRDQPDARQPLRVVVDGVLRTPPHAPLYTDGGASCVATARPLTDPAAQRLLAQGVAVWSLPAAGGERVDLPALLTRLATDAQINEVLVEAGMGLAGALAAAGLVDEWVIYLAPMLVGHSGRGLVDFAPLPDLAAAPRLTWHDCRRVGDDMRLTLR